MNCVWASLLLFMVISNNSFYLIPFILWTVRLFQYGRKFTTQVNTTTTYFSMNSWNFRIFEIHPAYLRTSRAKHLCRFSSVLLMIPFICRHVTDCWMHAKDDSCRVYVMFTCAVTHRCNCFKENLPNAFREQKKNWPAVYRNRRPTRSHTF